jgi:hypothetical protein
VKALLALTFNAVVKCSHDALVTNKYSQDWLTISEPSAEVDRARKPTPILIEPDPESCAITRCPMINVGILPCLLTLHVRAGYSTFLTVGGKPVCLKSLIGLTNGSPGVQEYTVRNAGQNFVECSE